MKRFAIPLVMLAFGLGFGLLSARYMMENASGAVPVSDSGWKEIRSDGQDVSSTYLAGHFLTRGQLPPPKGTRFYVRSEDDDGNSLRGDCLVTIEGVIPGARWWFVSAASGDGRRAIDVSQVVREASGETSLSLSTYPVPGNWMVPPGAGGYELQLVLLGMGEDAGGIPPALPRVKRLWC